MTGGSIKNGYYIIVSAEAPSTLGDNIKELSSVQDVNNKSGYIEVRLSQKTDA
jgi:hypothetical protein